MIHHRAFAAAKLKSTVLVLWEVRLEDPISSVAADYIH